MKKNINESDKFQIRVSKKDLEDKNKTKELTDLKKKNDDIEIVYDGNELTENSGIDTLEYLSEIKDSNTGEFSTPFTINSKKYQVVRAKSKKNGKINAVLSIDEVDENGNNKLYRIDEFEKSVMKANSGDNDSKTNKNFSGYKHFIVNKKNGKARKFKTISELAKANMTNDEEYMGIRDFKKYIDETLFGPKKQITEDDTVNMNDSDVQKINDSSKKLMKLITNKIPANVFEQIKKNKVAQRQVILEFIKIIGVEPNQLQKIIAGIKDITNDSVNERRIIKVKDLI